MKTTPLIRLLLASTFSLQLLTALAQGTAITYQGRLNDGGGPAAGTYDLRFTAYDALAGGSAVSGVVTNAATVVSNGLFTVTLDFGVATFTGADRWLQIGVRTNGGAAFTDLTPRQPLTSAPYAVRALNAGDAATASLANSVAAGSVGNAALQPGAVDSSKIADGSIGVADLSAVVLSNTFWRLGGNAGTTPGVNFLGTTDNQPLVIKVNGQEAMRYEPTTDAPNVIGGLIGNHVQPGLQGVTIGGGGSLVPFNGSPQPNVVASNGYYATIAGGYNNTVQGYGGAIVGGSVNDVVGNFGVIGGGQLHTIGLDAVYSVIGGGYGNTIETNAQGAVVAGGGANIIQHDTFSSSIGGGYGNTNGATFGAIGGGVNNSIESNNSSATIAGGQQNVIRENVSFGFIGGGTVNTIQTGSGYSAIAGGQQNTIEMNAGFSVIGGGLFNSIQPFADQSVVAGGNSDRILSGARESFIGGGFANTIQTNAAFSFIGAGTGNVIDTNSTWSTIAAGRDNLVQPNVLYSTIGGGQNNVIAPGARYSTIGGGAFNSAAHLSTVGGGQGNVISNGATSGTIGGGVANTIGTNLQYGTIGGGTLNRLSPFAHGSTIAGGWSNSILFNVQISAINGGMGNVIRTGADYSSIGGGLANSEGGYISVIAGGENNTIDSLADRSAISGGGGNRIIGSQALPVYSTISGGQNNSILTNAIYSTLSGGISNTVQAGSRYATIPGGASNSVAGAYTLAAGYRAKASHGGAFVWADATEADFTSTASNQFNVRASGGVRLETGGAGATIDGQQLLSGVVPNSSIVGTYSGAVTFNNSSDTFNGSFTGNGGGLSNVNAAALGGLSASNFWQIGGNLGSQSTMLGPITAQTLSLISGGRRMLRMDNASRSVFLTTWSAPNILGGSEGNTISNGVVGATISGGGAASQVILFPTYYPNLISDDFGTIGGGLNNLVGNTNADVADARAGTVSGGESNLVTATYATISGGFNNFIQPNSDAASIHGGRNNLIQNNSLLATISGGEQNVIESSAVGTTIGGGIGNRIQPGNDTSTIAGGVGNIVEPNSGSSTIGGGQVNRVQSSSQRSTIGGGEGNMIQNNSDHSTIAGGQVNLIRSAADHSAIGGGQNNETAGIAGTVGGGRFNHSLGLASTVPGGDNNAAVGQYSFAAGRRAIASHDGSFVWADSQNADFASTTPNQFNIRAAGGVQIVGAGLVSTGAGNGVYGVSSTANGVQGTSSGPGVSGVYGENFGGSGYGVAGRASGFNSAAIYGDSAGFGAWAGYFNGDVYVEGSITSPSDRNVKRDFESIDPQEVLKRLSQIPINTWAYTNSPGVRHLGPVAQDFKAAFNLGANDKSIATVDAAGVALAAIQGLNLKLEERTKTLETELKHRDAENAELKRRLDALERIVQHQQLADNLLSR